MKKGLSFLFAIGLLLGSSALAGAQTTVKFMTWEGPEMNKALLATFQEFEAQNPGIKVELIPSPITDYGTKINTMLSANEAPDLFMVGNDMGLSMGSLGMLQDWTDSYASDTEFTKSFYAGVLENWKTEGKIYAFPGLLNTYGVFYNKKLLKEAGVPVPTNGWVVGDLLSAAKKLAVKSGANKRFGLYGNFDIYTLSSYAAAEGAAPWANGIAKVTKVTADAKFQAVVQKFVDGIKDGSVMTPATDISQVVTLFKQGKIPMMVQGQWIADDLLRNAKDMDWGFVANPGSKASTIFDCVGWASPANVKNKDAVYKVAKFMVSKAYQKVLYTTPVAPTAVASASSLYFNRLKEGNHPEMAVALDLMASVPNKQPVRFQEAWSAKANRVVDAEWTNILNGKTPVSKLDDIAKKVNAVIQSAQ